MSKKKEAGGTFSRPGEKIDIFSAAMKYKEKNTPLIVSSGKNPSFPAAVYPNHAPISLTTINNHPTHSRFPAMPSTFIKSKQSK